MIRIDVYHHMLHFGVFLFHIFVYSLRNFVCLGQRYITLYGDFKIDIYFISELSGMQKIDAFHTRLTFDEAPEFLLKSVVTGSIQHFRDGIPDNIISDFQNEQADDQAGNGIHDRKAQPGHSDADKGTDRGDGIRTVVPCIRFKSG